MSWEVTREWTERAKCACGKGLVVRHFIEKGDDWNNYTAPEVDSETIECKKCADKYHIEQIGFYQRELCYLVPNEYTLNLKTKPETLEYERFVFFEERAVASFTKEELAIIVDDMRTSRFSTRLLMKSSKEIVQMYYRDKKRKNLTEIISTIEKCIESYDGYEWTFDKVKEFREKEAEILKMNKKEIDRILTQSYPLSFI